jgi:hypothetical protein
VALFNLLNHIFSCSGGKFSLTKMQVVALSKLFNPIFSLFYWGAF